MLKCNTNVGHRTSIAKIRYTLLNVIRVNDEDMPWYVTYTFQRDFKGRCLLSCHIELNTLCSYMLSV